MKLTPDTQIVHLKGIWISTSLALRQCNIRTLQDLSLVNLATTPSEIHKDQLVILLEASACETDMGTTIPPLNSPQPRDLPPDNQARLRVRI